MNPIGPEAVIAEAYAKDAAAAPQNRHRYGKPALDGAPVHGLLAWLWHRPT